MALSFQTFMRKQVYSSWTMQVTFTCNQKAIGVGCKFFGLLLSSHIIVMQKLVIHGKICGMKHENILGNCILQCYGYEPLHSDFSSRSHKSQSMT